MKNKILISRSDPQEVFLGKGVVKIYSKFTGEYPLRSVISIKLLSKIIEITLWSGYSPVNLLYIFRTHFNNTTYGGLHLNFVSFSPWIANGMLSSEAVAGSCKIAIK